jgi:putative transposase
VLRHEAHQAHGGANHSQAQNCRAADRPGQTVADIWGVIEVSQPKYHRWRQQYGGMQAEEAKRLTQLEKENVRLKKLLAEAELEKAMLKDLAEGNF